MNLHRLALPVVFASFGIVAFAQTPAAQGPAPSATSKPTAAATTQSGPAKAEADETQVKKALTTPAENLRLYHMPLLEAFNRVRELTGANVYVDIKSLRVEGVTSNTKVNFSAEKTTAADIIKEILKSVSLTKDSLGYDVLGRNIVISSKNRLRDLMVQYRTDLYKLGDPNIYKILGREIEEIKFERTPLRDAIKSLAASSGQEIQIDKTSLIIVGTSIETPITLNVKNVPLYQALRLVLNDVGGNVPMDYVIDDNTRKITVFAPAPQ